jgi:nucleoside-diphosphate-sugar epimerase
VPKQELTNDVKKSLHDASILITGASGFIGINLAIRLLEEGAVITTMMSPSPHRGRLRFLRNHCRVVPHDLRASMDSFLSNNAFSLVFHLAAMGTDSRDYPAHDILGVNVASTIELVHHVQRTKGKMIWAGSVFELGSCSQALKETSPPRPISDYGWTKSIALDYLKRFAPSPSWTALRFFGVYGPYEAPHRLIPYMITRLLENQEAELTNGEQVRDWVFVDDVIDAMLLSATTGSVFGEVFHVGTGQGVSTRKVAETVANMLGKEHLLRFGARKRPDAEPECMIADITRARERIGWEPKTDLAEGIRKTVEWHLSNREMTDVREFLSK